MILVTQESLDLHRKLSCHLAEWTLVVQVDPSVEVAVVQEVEPPVEDDLHSDLPTDLAREWQKTRPDLDKLLSSASSDVKREFGAELARVFQQTLLVRNEMKNNFFKSTFMVYHLKRQIFYNAKS